MGYATRPATISNLDCSLVADAARRVRATTAAPPKLFGERIGARGGHAACHSEGSRPQIPRSGLDGQSDHRTVSHGVTLAAKIVSRGPASRACPACTVC